MCGIDEPDPLLLIHRALEAAAEMLLGIDVVSITKAMDLTTPGGFDRAVGLLAATLRGAARGAETEAVRAVVGSLDVDWARTSARERRRLVATAMQAAGRAVSIIPDHIQVPLGDAARAIVARTRSDARRAQGLPIAAAPNALDRRVMDHIVRSQGNFVRDAYGRRLDALGERARQIVATGLEQGLGRDDIAEDLERAAKSALTGRSPFYWEVVASSFVGRGRSFAQLSSFAEAGIERYEFVAVLDERTTDICRYMNGRTFSVETAVKRFDRIEQLDDPEDIVREQPWVRQWADRETGQTLLYVNRGDERRSIAEVTRSGVGTRDDPGDFRSIAAEGALEGLGVTAPPLHGLCRSTLSAVT